MAETWFTPKEWKARLVEFAGRRLLRNVANGETTTYDVSRSEGQISQEGDAFNTKNMNDLEQRISNGFANAKTNIDALNSDLGGCSLEQENGNFYIVGADAVRKNWVAMALLTSEKCHTLVRRIMANAHCLLFATKSLQPKNVTIKNLNESYNIRQIIPAHIGGVLCFLAIVDVTNLNKGATIDTDSSDTKRVFIIQ